MTNDPYASVTPAPYFSLVSDDLVDGAEKPLRFRDPAIGGEDLSPHLAWSGFPAETKSFAVTCYDPDAPTGVGFMHWAVANIPVTTTELAEGAGTPGAEALAAALTIPNDVRVRGYVGANPPGGSGRHRYVFVVHAVDVPTLEIDPELTPTVLGFNLHFHTLGRAVLTVWVDPAE